MSIYIFFAYLYHFLNHILQYLFLFQHPLLIPVSVSLSISPFSLEFIIKFHKTPLATVGGNSEINNQHLFALCLFVVCGIVWLISYSWPLSALLWPGLREITATDISISQDKTGQDRIVKALSNIRVIYASRCDV